MSPLTVRAARSWLRRSASSAWPAAATSSATWSAVAVLKPGLSLRLQTARALGYGHKPRPFRIQLPLQHAAPGPYAFLAGASRQRLARALVEILPKSDPKFGRWSLPRRSGRKPGQGQQLRTGRSGATAKPCASIKASRAVRQRPNRGLQLPPHPVLGSPEPHYLAFRSLSFRTICTRAPFDMPSSPAPAQIRFHPKACARVRQSHTQIKTARVHTADFPIPGITAVPLTRRQRQIRSSNSPSRINHLRKISP